MILERIDIDTTEDRLQFVLHRNRYDFVLARLPPRQSVLEIGTGPGTFTRELAPKCGSYVGVEYDPETCLAARQKNEGRAEIIEADAKHLPFEDSRFSFIICLEVLEHLGDFRAGVKQIHRCLRADGMAIVSVPYRRTGGKSKTNPYHLYEPGERELVGLLESLFTKVEVYYQWFPETQMMTLARKLHLRRFLGLSQIYADLSAGLPQVTSQFRISPQPKGLIEGLIVVVGGKRTLSV
jgi:SAM-dependent methyltransferase